MAVFLGRHGVGIVAVVASFAMLLAEGPYGARPQYLPWCLPMLVLARQPHDIGLVIVVSGGLALLIGAAGCADFCRREVT